MARERVFVRNLRGIPHVLGTGGISNEFPVGLLAVPWPLRGADQSGALGQGMIQLVIQCTVLTLL